MAKGNMILGYLRGAIGDIVFWRAKGQQMARARNRAPANPRTEYQMTQRAKWANVAKFVKMAPPRFFKFAFEGKGVSLTDYNVFYRENILRSPMISRTASANPAYPALGNFVMSRGSLQSIGALTEYAAVSLDTPFFKLAEGNNITIPSEAGRTVAWLTNQLIALSPSRYRVGDVLTFVKISCNNFGTPLVYPELNDYGYLFQYFQIVLSTTDTTLVKSQLGGFARLNTLGDNKILGISYGSTSGSTGAVEWSGDLKATCMIHTRNVLGGVLVSSEELTVNDNYALLTEQALTNSVYIQQVLTDWRSAETAILQGSSVTVETIQYLNTSSIICGVYSDPSGGRDEVSTTPSGTITTEYSYIGDVNVIYRFPDSVTAARALELVGDNNAYVRLNGTPLLSSNVTIERIDDTIILNIDVSKTAFVNGSNSVLVYFQDVSWTNISCTIVHTT